jgi:hypothetical protein
MIFKIAEASLFIHLGILPGKLPESMDVPMP